MAKIIEKMLPLSEINSTAIHERTAANGHPANLHMWWGRSSMPSVLAALTAGTADITEDADTLAAILKHVASCDTGDITHHMPVQPTVFDPFSGSGFIPLAAQALGFPVIASDLNPVAVMITKALVEIPSRFQNQQPVNPQLERLDYFRVEGMAEDIRQYGKWMLLEAKKRLAPLYPKCEGETPSAWLWVRTVKCPNPACGCQMPLATSFILNGRKGNEAWAEPVVQNGIIHFEVHSGICPKDKETNKYGSYGAKFVCPACGEVTADDYVKRMGLTHQLGTQMMAVAYETTTGRIFKAPNEEQIAAANVPIPEDIPQGSIPDNAHWFSPPGFGFTEYADLFSPRQLTMLTTFCDLLKEVQNKAASDALAAGLSPEGGSLADGGSGAMAYGQAISVYLAFAIDKMADRNSMFGSWNSSGGNPRATFGRQAIPMVWNFGEINPFSGITGNFAAALSKVADVVTMLPAWSDAVISQYDAVHADFPQNVMICTDLPYYKNIGYAHLSDYFYIWMRQSLKWIYPDLFNQMVTSKEELSTVNQYYGVSPSESDRLYQEQLAKVIQKLKNCQSPEWPALMFYEYHKYDEQVIRNGADEVTPWEYILQSMINAGFAIKAIWPLRTTEANEKSDTTKVLIVGEVANKTSQITRRGFISVLKHDLPDLLDTAFGISVDSVDQQIVGMGFGLSIFSQYRKILNADGSVMSVHDALPIILQEVEEYIAIHASVEDDVQSEED